MRIPTTQILLALAAAAGAATYHLSSAGNDTRTAVEAGSEATPWGSLERLVGVGFGPGDSILLRRGDTLRGTLRLSKSGSKALPIFVGAYGPGAQPPTILGTIPVTGWLATPSGAWKAKIPSKFPVRRVFSGGIPLRNARWPDTGWLRTKGHSGDTAVFAPEASGTDWTGASLYLWNLNWDLEGHVVKAQSGDHLVLSRRNGIGISDTALYYLSNHPAALKAPGTWVYTASDSSLLHLGPKPADSALEASVFPDGIDLRGANWVTVEGLRVAGSADTGIAANGQGITVENCEVRFSDHVGIHLQGTDVVARGNRVFGSSSAGITLRAKHGLAEGNFVTAIQDPRWLSPNGMGASCCTGNGINAWGDTSIARFNRVDSIGFNAIGFGGVGTLVTRNHVTNFCMLQNDCAGVYTGPQLPPQSGSEGSIVRRNVVHDSHKSAWPWAWPAANGIYLDAYAHDILADSNVVWNVDNGFHGNNGRGIVYQDNLVYAPRSLPGNFANNDSLRMGTPIGATLRRNLSVLPPGGRGEYSRYLPVAWQSQAGLDLSGNVFCEDQVTRISCRRDSSSIWTAPTLDPAAPLFGPQAVPNGDFDSSVLTWRSWPNQLVPRTDSGTHCPSPRCLRVDYVGDTLAGGSPYVGTPQTIATDSGQGWWLRFEGRAKRPGLRITAVFRRPSDYATIGLAATAVLDTNWQEYSYHFKATRKLDVARLDFHCPKKDSTFWLAKVLLRHDADSAALASLGPRTALLWNADSTAAMREVPPGRWVDETGHPVSARVELPAFSGKALFRVFEDPILSRRESHTAVPGWKVGIHGGSIFLEYLSGPVDIVDARGLRLAHLVPGPSGLASWDARSRRGIVWVRSAGVSRAVLLAR